MGKDVAYITAPQTISMLYADDKDNIYSLKSDSNSPQKIGTYSDTVNLKTITDDGNIAVWTVSEGKNRTIVLSENGDNSVLDEFESNYDGVYVRYTKDQKLLVVVNIFGEEIWLKEPNKEHVRVKLGNEISSIVVYAPNGELQNQTISSVKSIYVIVDGDTDYNIYNISLDGEKERILSKVKKFAIGNGYVFYTNSDQDLYSAKIKETKIEDETKIASDVGTFDLAGNGKYLYYFRDCEDDYGSLYALKLGEKDPKKVSSDVYYDYTSLYGVYTYSYNRYSTDGATVYYWKDAESILDTYTDYGTLMKWNYSTEKAEKVASDVIVSSVSSYLTNYGINPKKIVFSKYNSKDKDGTIIVDVMSYNGSEVSKIISEAKR